MQFQMRFALKTSQTNKKTEKKTQIHHEIFAIAQIIINQPNSVSMDGKMDTKEQQKATISIGFSWENKMDR